MKNAIATILVHLFDKESSVCIEKITTLHKITDKYEINSKAITNARGTSLEEAVKTLKDSEEDCQKFLDYLKKLAKSDGLYTTEELLIHNAIKSALTGNGEIVTVPHRAFTIEKPTAFYFDSRKNTADSTKEELKKLFSTYDIGFVTAEDIVKNFASEDFTKEMDGIHFYFGNYGDKMITEAMDKVKKLDNKKLGKIILTNHEVPEEPYLLIKFSDSNITNEPKSLDKKSPLLEHYNLLILPIVKDNPVRNVEEFLRDEKDLESLQDMPKERLLHFDIYRSLLSHFLITGKDSSITICPQKQIVIFNDLINEKGYARYVELNINTLEYFFIVWQTLYWKELQKIKNSYAINVLNHLLLKYKYTFDKSRPYYQVERDEEIDSLIKGRVGDNDSLGKYKFSDNFRKIAKAIDEQLYNTIIYTPNPEDYTTYADTNKNSSKTSLRQKKKSSKDEERKSSPHYYKITNITKKVYIVDFDIDDPSDAETLTSINFNPKNNEGKKEFMVNTILKYKKRTLLKGSTLGKYLLEIAKKSVE